MIKFLQINVGVCGEAHDFMEATAKELQVDVVIVSEQLRNKPEEEGWYSDLEDKAAVAVYNPGLSIFEIGPKDNRGFRWIEVGGIRVYSCYWSPNTDFASFENFLDRLETSIRSSESPVLVAGDFNAKSPEWGDHREDQKGRLLADWLASLNLSVCNQGDKPTFSRVHETGVSRSHIDITLVTESLNHTVCDWKVLDRYTASLHRYITFTVTLDTQPYNQSSGKRWSWRRFDRSKLCEFLRSTNAGVTLDTEAFDKFLGQACDACMPKGTYKGGKKPAFWWTNEIAELRSECLKARRKYKRSRSRKTSVDGRDDKENFKKCRRELKIAIRRSKEASWNKLCAQVETDPWGLPFKLVTKKLLGRRAIPGLTIPGRLDHIVDSLFPTQTEIVWPPLGVNNTFPEISHEEITQCGLKTPLGKAPGPDGVPDMVIKEIARSNPEMLRSLLNTCFEQGVFPENWKVAKLVLLRKGSRPLDCPSSYRPICLMNTVGKFFERIIKMRLEKHLEDTDGLNDKQYGFRKGRSTVDAALKIMETVDKYSTGPLYKRQLCAVVALDVQNAFNSARWERIERALHQKKVPNYIIRILQSYLSHRRLQYGEERYKTVTCGVPQGSVIGPLLWNLMYNSLLEVDTEGNTAQSSTNMVAFADDVAIITTGRTTQLLEEVTNRALEKVAQWMEDNGLELSAKKTEAIILTSKRAYQLPSFTIKDFRIQPQEQLRYLGVELHRVLGFKKHLEMAAAKAQSTATKLSRLMPNTGGSRQRNRRLLASVVNSLLLYASPVWGKALVFDRNVNTIERPQRTIALRVASAYRTVSSSAVMVIAGIIPAHLTVWERQERYRRQRGMLDRNKKDEEIRKILYQKWQSEWDTASTGRWTRRLIKSIEPWVGRRFGNVDFHLTQMLSGHGCFGHYLYRFKKLEDPSCVDCNSQCDDAEHAIFDCDRWWSKRRDLEVQMGAVVSPDTIVGLMLRSRDNWKAMKNFVTHVMSTREEEERRRQAQIIVAI